MRVSIVATLFCALALTTVSCARPPRPNYAFDNQPGGWRLDDTVITSSLRCEQYVHEVHPERFEVIEVSHAAPATDSAGFAALPERSRRVPPLGEPTATPRALGDETISGVVGYWVEQHGSVDGAMVQSAAYVIPNGRRYFVVRMISREDEVEQLRGWVRDLVLRTLRFPPPRR